MSVQVSYKKQFLFGFILVMVILSSIEISARVFDYYNPNCRFIESDVYEGLSFDIKRQLCDDHYQLTWNNDPLYLIPNQHYPTINVNSDGFRGNELQEEPNYRIFVIGGSTTFGVGTMDNESIPSFLQQIINKNFGNDEIEVINAGIPKAYSYTENYLIKNKILDFEPDMLIIYDGSNDVGTNYKNFGKSGDPVLSDIIIREMYRLDISTPKVLLKLYFNYKHDNIETIPFNSENIEKKVTFWRDTSESICNLGETYDFKTIVILQPLLGTGNKILTDEEEGYAIHYDVKTRNKFYELYANELTTLESCSKTIDLRDIFDQNLETIYYDAGHLGKEGNKIVAQQIYDEILPILTKHIQN